VPFTVSAAPIASRAARICASSAPAGSSVGSYGTSRPANAAVSMPYRSRSARFRFAAIVASNAPILDKRRSISATVL